MQQAKHLSRESAFQGALHFLMLFPHHIIQILLFPFTVTLDVLGGGFASTALSADQDDYISYNYIEQTKVFLKERIIHLRLIYIRFCHDPAEVTQEKRKRKKIKI